MNQDHQGRDKSQSDITLAGRGPFPGQDDDEDVDRIFSSYRRRESVAQMTRDGGSHNGRPSKESPVDDVFDERVSPDEGQCRNPWKDLTFVMQLLDKMCLL